MYCAAFFITFVQIKTISMTTTTNPLTETLTQQEAFKKVFELLELINSKGLIYVDSLEWQLEEQKFTLWGQIFPFKQYLGFKVPLFDKEELTKEDPTQIDAIQQASQVLIFKKLEILTSLVLSKEFTEYGK